MNGILASGSPVQEPDARLYVVFARLRVGKVILNIGKCKFKLQETLLLDDGRYN